MRYFAALLLLFAFSFTLPACAQKATPTSQTKQKGKAKKASKKAAAPATQASTVQGKQDAEPVLTFERTPCFGTCPAYKMQVYADGRVAYEGRRAVPVMGTKELKMAPAALADLLRMAKEAHFEQFQERYSKNTSDLPSTVIGIRQPNGQLKTVVVEEGAPDNVQNLFNRFANQFDALAELRADK
ncbi:hypothetical protein AUC43_10865 [Hymenobacter sedentarius]|uniref:DUF6438 domain-containing protein n=1 Tax=Hymenobacter sedentarius TaxID=1411621 RepID=A0A0U4BG67_9BACT|nr:DUF6438 domain-containing protein [Hymenobacter sedentarius]ALW85547.1 hypothetical protein AUC43_10865 [Hymenobacter sedentarius]